MLIHHVHPCFYVHNCSSSTSLVCITVPPWKCPWSQGPCQVTANLHAECVFLCCNISFYLFFIIYCLHNKFSNVHFSINNGQTSRVFTGVKLGPRKITKSETTRRNKLVLVLSNFKQCETKNEPGLCTFGRTLC